MTAERKRIEFNTVDELAHACIDFNRRCRANRDDVSIDDTRMPVERLGVDLGDDRGPLSLSMQLEHG